MTGGAASAFAPGDWLPVQDALLRGLNHALSNRLSSLGAIAMLVEGADRLDERMQAAFSADVEKLGDLLALYRLVPAEPTPRRDAARIGDALARARALLEHHPDCRNITFEVAAGAKDVEPVTLSGRDALRASVMLLLAAARGAGGAGAVRASVAMEDGVVQATARSPRENEATIAGSHEAAALARFAANENGRVVHAPDSVTLALPGLGRTRTVAGAAS